MNNLVIWSIGLDRKDDDPLIRRDTLNIIKPETEMTSLSEESISSINSQDYLSTVDQLISEPMDNIHENESPNLILEEINSTVTKPSNESIRGAYVKLDRAPDHACIPICISQVDKPVKSILNDIHERLVQPPTHNPTHEIKEETKHKITKSFRNIYSRLIS